MVAEPAPVVVEPVVAEPVVEEPVEAPAPPEPPKVITRTRGRVATRPAGPPAEVAGSSDEDGADDDGTQVEHVPIKKKGSRKR